MHQPSSAVDRIFSILKFFFFFNTDQNFALEDYIEVIFNGIK